jgi:hypothetical protein
MIPENLPAVSELKQSKLQLQQYVLQATRKDFSKIHYSSQLMLEAVQTYVLGVFFSSLTQ